MKTIATIILTLSSSLFSFGSNYYKTKDLLHGKEDTVPRFQYLQGDVSLGAAYGIHPNYLNTFSNGFVYGEGIQKFSYKNHAFTARFRASEEKYRSGQSGYFRLSYDGQQGFRQNIEDYRVKIEGINSKIGLSQDSLAKLEGKLSYFNLKMLELKNLQLPDTSLKSFGVDTLGALIPVYPTLPDGTISTVPDWVFPLKELKSPQLPGMPGISMDSLQATLDQLEKLRELQLKDIEALKLKKLDYEKDYGDFIAGRSKSFFEGIRRFDVGLTTLSPGSMSNNAVPMNGFQVAGDYRNWFYSLASGFSLPNQLFSSQAFDQLISNTANVFNVNNFFAVNNVRFVSSAIVGYGEKDKKSVAVETFYSGRSFDEIRKKESGNTTTTINLSGCITPDKNENLTLKGTVSTSFASGIDTTNASKKLSDRSALRGELDWRIPKLRSMLSLNYRSLGTDYEGWSQGILIRGANTADAAYRQRLGRRSYATLRGAQGNYISPVTEGLVRKTRQAGIDFQVKMSRTLALNTSYTLLRSSGDTISRMGNTSHLGTVMLTHSVSKKKWKFLTTVNGSVAYIPLIDSVQQINMVQIHHQSTAKKFYAGVTLTGSQFKGIGRLYGQNLIISPEAGLTLPTFRADLVYQQLFSDQFGRAGGLKLNVTFNLGNLFTVTYSMQQWLPTDYVFFLDHDPDLQKPLYINGKLTLHIK